MANQYYYYIQIGDDNGTVFNLDSNAIQIGMPGITRNYSQIPLFNDGSFIVGQGNLVSGSITFDKTFRAGKDDKTAWNTLRQNVMKLMGTPKWTDVWFYIVDANMRVMKAKVYPLSTSGEGYSTFRISDTVTFTLMMEKGYFEAVDDTTYSKTLTSKDLTQLYVTNSGSVSVAPVIEFISTINFTLFQVQMAIGYGFRIETTFNIGDDIIFDCSTGQLTINGIKRNNYQTAGSSFQLPTGQSILSIIATSGTFSIKWNERFI